MIKLKHIAGWCNGSTDGPGPSDLGSNPSPAAKMGNLVMELSF